MGESLREIVCRFLLVKMIVLILPFVLLGYPNDNADIRKKEIAALIRQLGSLKANEREEASRKLVEIGDHALDFLRRAVNDNDDPEIVARAKRAIQAIEAELVGKPRTFAGPKVPVLTMALSPDHRYVLSSDELLDARPPHFTKLWERETGKQVLQFQGHTDGRVMSLSFSPDGKHGLSTGVAEGDFNIRIWDLDTGKELRRFLGHTAPVYSAQLSADGKQMLSCSTDMTIRLWNAETAEEIRRFEGHTSNVIQAVFSPDGRRVLSSSMDRTIRLWDLESGKELLKLDSDPVCPWRVAFSPDGKRALSVGGTAANVKSDYRMRLWDLEAGKELMKFEGHESAVIAVAFSPDGKRALSGSIDKTARLWDLESGKELRRYHVQARTVLIVAFSKDGKEILIDPFLVL